MDRLGAISWEELLAERLRDGIHVFSITRRHASSVALQHMCATNKGRAICA